MRRFWLLLLLTLSLMSYAKGEDIIIPCRHSQEMLDLVLEGLSSAEQKVELSLCFAGGKVLLDILERLEKKMQQLPHFQVYMLCSPILLIDSDLDKINELLALYPKQFHHQLTYTVLNALPEIVAIDTHIKMITIDDKYFVVGGTNFDEAFICEATTPRPHVQPGGLARDNLPNGNRDQDVVGRGDLAQQMSIAFYKQYALWEHYNKSKCQEFIHDPEYFSHSSAYKPLEKEAKKAVIAAFETSSKKIKVQGARFILSGPMDSPNKITQEYEQLIRGAKQRIYIGNLYFNPDPSIASALFNKVKEGVRCHLISNGLFDHSPFFHNAFVWANRLNYLPLFYGKQCSLWEKRELVRTPSSTTIHEFCVPGIMYHKKVAVVDNCVIIGSYNLGLRSATTDYEVILVVDSPELAESFINILEEDKKYSQEITKEQAIEWYFDPLIGFLGAVQRQFHGFF